MPVFIEQLQQNAERLQAKYPEAQIASRPSFARLKGTRDLRMSIDVGTTMDFMSGYGYDPSNLQSMLICTYPMTDARTHFLGMLTGRALALPHASGQLIHYPVIELGISKTEEPSEAVLNHVFRHELKHILQDNKKRAWYDRPVARHGTRAVGAVATAASLATLGMDFLNIMEQGVMARAGLGVGRLVRAGLPDKRQISTQLHCSRNSPG